MRSNENSKTTEAWTSEKLYFEFESFVEDLIKDLRTAKNHIDIEFYTMEKGEFLDKLVETLIQKRQEGVRVRVLADGFGSYFSTSYLGAKFAKTNVEFKEYHPLPWRLFSPEYFSKITWSELPKRYLYFMMQMNRRNHRKIVAIDKKIAWIGSKNVQDDRWRETAARVEGPSVEQICRIFSATWLNIGAKKFFKNPKPHEGDFWTSDYIRFNSTRKIRKHYNRFYLNQIKNASKRIWITNPYFVPTLPILRTLIKSAKKGLDVRIIFPMKSDVPGILWVARLYYQALLRAKIRIFEYKKAILHAKTVLVDDELWVGSTNLNHRSFLHDLEIDVKLTRQESIDAYQKQFEIDLENAMEIDTKYSRIPNWFGRIFIYPIYLLRHWI